MVNEKSIDISLFTVENEKSISELFQSINNIHNDMEENEKIWSEISRRIKDSVIKFEERNKKKKRNTYKTFLESLQATVNKQIEEVTSIIDEKPSDASISVDTLEEELLDTISELKEKKYPFFVKSQKTGDTCLQCFKSVFCIVSMTLFQSLKSNI